MTQESFEDMFPSLKGEGLFIPDAHCLEKEDNVFHREEIMEFCLDKQKVREAIKKYLYYDAAGMNAPLHLSVKDFEKELGLGDEKCH